MPKVEFTDFKTKEKFRTDDFGLEIRQAKGRAIHFAVADNPSGSKSWKIISKANYDMFKNNGLEDRS